MDARNDAMRRRGVGAWALVGCALVAMIAIYVLGLVWPAVELLLVGLVVGFICSPLTNSLDDRGMPRAMAALVALLVVVLVVGMVLLVVVPPLAAQLAGVLQRVPTYAATVRQWIQGFWDAYGSARTADAQQVLDQVVSGLATMGTRAASDLAEKLSGGIISNVMGLGNSLMTFFLGLILAYWLAKDYPLMVREVSVIAGPRHEQSFLLLLAVLTRSVGGYMRAAAVTSLVNGALVWLALAVASNPYAALLGFVTAVLHFLPVIGPLLSALSAVLLSLFLGVGDAIAALAICIIAQNVVDNLLSPLVMQSTVNVHPALTLVGILVGSALGGVLGMVVAIPATAAITSVFVYYFEQGSGRQLVSFDGAFFRGQPFHTEDGGIDAALDALGDPGFFKRTRLMDGSYAQGGVADENPAAGASAAGIAAQIRRGIDAVEESLRGREAAGEGSGDGSGEDGDAMSSGEDVAVASADEEAAGTRSRRS